MPNTPEKPIALIRDIKRIAKTLDVVKRLNTYGAALQTIEQSAGRKAHYYLLALNPNENTLRITGYGFAELDRATKDYLRLERSFENIPAADSVLVSVESVSALKRAYPNYFLDTKLLAKAVNDAIAT